MDQNKNQIYINGSLIDYINVKISNVVKLDFLYAFTFMMIKATSI